MVMKEIGCGTLRDQIQRRIQKGRPPSSGSVPEILNESVMTLKKLQLDNILSLLHPEFSDDPIGKSEGVLFARFRKRYSFQQFSIG